MIALGIEPTASRLACGISHAVTRHHCASAEFNCIATPPNAV